MYSSYDALVDYWNGKTTKVPDKNDVYAGLMELAASAKCENNIVHKDVIDAMMRQPFSKEARLFQTNNILTGTIIKAADYDLGVNGSAYYDKDTANYRISTGKESTGNLGGTYRNDRVDIYKDSGLSDSYYVGNIEDGEWLQYTVTITKAGIYTLTIIIAADKDGGVISIKDDAISLSQNTKVPATGGEKSWKTIAVKNISLSTGVHHLRVYAEKGGFNFASIGFTK